MTYLDLVVGAAGGSGHNLDPPVLIELLEPIASLLDLFPNLPMVTRGPLHKLDVDRFFLLVSFSLSLIHI